MRKIVLLDTGILGLATNPNTTVNKPIVDWLNQLIKNGHKPVVPDIADYELRRELIRRQATNALSRLDQLGVSLQYLQINTETLRRASVYWAQSRNVGRPLASDDALDGDVILCAQAKQIVNKWNKHSIVVATTNVRHVANFVDAYVWSDIH